MNIDVSQLRAVTEKLLAHVESKRTSVEIDVDYYWDIPKDARYDPAVEPKELTLGQLSDDWDELGRIAGGQAEPLGYALVWLAAVMRAVGETVVE